MHADPRAGNGALRLRRRARRRTDRPGLDCRTQAGWRIEALTDERGGFDLRQAEFRQGALGARGARRLALQGAGRSARRDDRDRARARHEGVLRRDERRRQRRVLVGRDRGQAAGAGGRDRRSDRNRLEILDTVMESNTQLIANDAALADPWKRTKIENIALLLRAAIEAQGRVGLMLNVRRSDLAAVLALLPALQRPTISSLSDEDWVAVNTIIEERTVRDLIPRLKAAGGEGIVEYPLNKIVL